MLKGSLLRLVRKWVQRPSRRGEQFGQWLIKADPVPVSVGRPKITGVPGAGVNGTNGAFFRVVYWGTVLRQRAALVMLPS